MTETRGIILAAPASGSGKTIVTLGLLRHFARQGMPVSSFKVGPDFIDPAFHAAATGRPCVNFDSWAMRTATLEAQFAFAADQGGIVIGEGVMGLFDGAPGGLGSTSDAASRLGLPVVLVVDASGLAQSAAAMVQGFATWSDKVKVAGAIYNRVGSDRHAALLLESAGALDIPVLGCLPRSSEVAVDHRHLGLVQASENPALESLLDAAADLVAEHLDLDALCRLMAPVEARSAPCPPLPVSPPGQRISLASDDAFRFCYHHLVDGWRRKGAEIIPFSPLADQSPDPSADAIYLPGGYPELYAGRLTRSIRFMDGLHKAASRNAVIYGECGGYMTLGKFLTDRDGNGWYMAGLLPLETSFAEPSLHLGYREARLVDDCVLGPRNAAFGTHEFHYAVVVKGNRSKPAFYPPGRLGKLVGERRSSQE